MDPLDSPSNPSHEDSISQLAPSKSPRGKFFGLVICTLFLTVAVGGFLLRQQAGLRPSSSTASPMSTPSPQASSNADFTVSEVEGWQTYRNEEYGFEFQVPESLFNVFFSGSKGIDSLNEYKLLSKEYQHPSNLDQIIIDIERMAGDNLEKKQTSIKELRKAKVGERLFNLETTKEQIIKAKDIDIGGCIGTEAYDEISENQIKAIVFGCLTKENIHLRLVFITKELSKDNKKLFDQILSTFRFVDGGREEGNAAKTACEQSGDAYAACSANPSQNAGICVSCQCPEDSMWSFNKEMCITM